MFFNKNYLKIIILILSSILLINFYAGTTIAFDRDVYPFSSCYVSSYSQNNAFMAGDVGALCVFIESGDNYRLREGERYVEDWKTVNENTIYSDVKNSIFNDISVGVGNWFINQYDRFIPENDERHPLTFEFFREDVEIEYEPAYYTTYTGMNKDDDLWIDDFMDEFSEIKDRTFRSISDVCEYYRDVEDKDWFYVIFIINDYELNEHNMNVKAENDARHADERLKEHELDLIPSHWTYTWEDFIVLSFYHWKIYKMDTVADPIVHETCHIFGATDEYVIASRCGDKGDSVLRIPNLNHENCDSDNTVDCIMGNNRSSQYYEEVLRNAFLNEYFCKYSAWQIGWRDLDCDGLIDPLDEYPFEIDKPELTFDSTHSFPVVYWEYPECQTVDYYEYRVDNEEWQYLGYINHVSLDEIPPNIEHIVQVRAVNDALKKILCFESDMYSIVSEPLMILYRSQELED